MKIEWSVVRHETHKAFFSFTKNVGSENYLKTSGGIYVNSYRPVVRPVTDGESAAVKKANETWKDDAKSKVGRTSQGAVVGLQIRRGGKLERVFRPEDLRHDDSVDCVLHRHFDATNVSRVQVVVNAETAGMKLHQMLNQNVQWGKAVTQWKVMSPDLGSTGPDSAVIYFSVPLNDAKVIATIGSLEKVLGDVLAPLNTPPFGLMTVSRGIYGADIPTEEQQGQVLKMKRLDFGSAGTIISRVITESAYRLACNYLAGGAFNDSDTLASSEAWQKEFGKSKEALDQELKGEMKSLLSRELEWELVD